MGDCCTTPPVISAERALCPQCGQAGRRVERVTVKALLRRAARRRLSQAEQRFCPTPACPVVYFSGEDTFHRKDVRVPVFQKEPPGQRTVCYCFGVTESDIQRELSAIGTAMAYECIAAHVRAGHCICEIRNPQGTCCLGQVAEVTRRAQAELRTDTTFPTR